MKKLTLPLLAGLALITAGCSNDETVEVPKGQAIAFENPFVNKTGRADDLTGNNLKLFKVWGSSSLANDYIFNGQEVEVAGINSEYNPPRYWSANSTYHFMAIATQNMMSDAALAEGAVRSWTYDPGTVPADDYNGSFGTLTFDNSISEGLEDLSYAVAHRTTGATISTTEEAVKLTFNHALSRIRFYFRNNMPTGYYVEVENIKVSELPQSGTLVFGENMAWSNSGAYEKTLAWEVPTVTGDESNYIEKDKTKYTEAVFTLPSAEKFKVEFDINLYMKDGDNYVCMNGETAYHHSVEIEVSQGTEPNIVKGLLMGTAYAFSAVIGSDNVAPGGLKKIEFTTEVVPFANGGVSTILETPSPSGGQEENI